MSTQQQRSEATRARLIASFRASFLEHGVEATTTEAVLRETGLSKGALYHHFRSKTEIAEAIYEAESHGAIDRAFKSVDHTAPPLVRLREACIAWLQEVQNRDISRILFSIGPQALGPMRAKQIEDGYSLARFEQLLADAIDRGDIALKEPALAARLVNAVVAEVALQPRTRRDAGLYVIGPAIDALLQAIASKS